MNVATAIETETEIGIAAAGHARLVTVLAATTR
jgi:hypothetical protein